MKDSGIHFEDRFFKQEQDRSDTGNPQFNSDAGGPNESHKIKDIRGVKFFPKQYPVYSDLSKRSKSIGSKLHALVPPKFLKFYNRSLPVQFLTNDQRVELLKSILIDDHDYYETKYDIDVPSESSKRTLNRSKKTKGNYQQSLG